MRRLATVICLLQFVYWAAIALGHGPAPVDITYRVGEVPARVHVMRGTLLHFEGETEIDVPPTAYILRVGSTVRASGRFEGRWKLTWDSAKESSPICYLSAFHVKLSGAEERLFRLPVEILDKVPFRLSAPHKGAAIDGTLRVAVERTSDLLPDSYELLVDMEPVRCGFDGAGCGVLDVTEMKPGHRAIAVRVKMAGGSELLTPAVDVHIVPKVAVEPLDNGNVIDLRRTASNRKVAVRLVYTDSTRPRSVELRLDGTPISRTSSPPYSEFQFDPEGLFSGTHVLCAEVVTEDGKHLLSDDLLFAVERDAARELGEWQRVLRRIVAQASAHVALARRQLLRVDELPEAIRTVAATRVALRELIPSALKMQPPLAFGQEDRQVLTNALVMYAEGLDLGARACAAIDGYLTSYQGAVARYGSNVQRWSDSVVLRLASLHSGAEAAVRQAGRRLDRAEANVRLIKDRLGERKEDEKSP